MNYLELRSMQVTPVPWGLCEVVLRDLTHKACPKSSTCTGPTNSSCLQGEVFGNHLFNLSGCCHLIWLALHRRSRALGFAPQLLSSCSWGHPQEPTRDTWPEENCCQAASNRAFSPSNFTVQHQNTARHSRLPEGRPETIQYFISKSPAGDAWRGS